MHVDAMDATRKLDGCIISQRSERVRVCVCVCGWVGWVGVGVCVVCLTVCLPVRLPVLPLCLSDRLPDWPSVMYWLLYVRLPTMEM